MDSLRPQDPAHIGSYTVLARLGAGGMGQVYLGRSPGGRLVALKVIRDEITDHPEALARFRREVETVRAVRSAYTANLIDASLDTAPYWLATEYVSGPTLSDAVRDRGPLPAETVRGIAAALAEGLGAVHQQGVTHRDLKPQNVILSGQGPQLIDFGIARGAEQTALTEDGTAPGTPGFTAPEVLMRNEVGPAADVFALGATLAFAVTGRAPFGGGNPASVSYRAVHEPIDTSGVQPGLAALIEDCVAKEAGQRPGLAEVVARCGVQSALVDDPVYAALGASAEPAPRTPAATPPAGTHDLPTASAVGQGYTPTHGAYPAPASPTSPPAVARKRRVAPWTVAAAVGLVVGGGVASLVVLNDKGGDHDAAGGNNTPTSPGATSPSTGGASPAPGTPTGGDKNGRPAGVPDHIEETEPSREYWDHGTGMCNLPAQERPPVEFQDAISDADDELAQTVTGKVRIGYRFKFDAPKGEPYYVTVTVKPPHEIDPDTVKPVEGLLSQNLSMGYSSKPVDLTAGDETEWRDLVYPDDFTSYANGRTWAPVPPQNDPGDWTVFFHHVRGPKDYSEIMCDGFVAR